MLLDITRTQELEMPNEITISHANTANAYQKGTQQHRRRSGHSTQQMELELAIAMTPERALKCARVLLYAAVAARMTVKWTTTMRHSKLIPSNVVRLNADGQSLRVAIKERNTSQGVVEFIGEIDNARAYEQGGEAAAGVVETPYAGDVVRSIAISLVKVYDLPRLDQSDPTPLAYASLTVTDGTFTGSNLYIKKNEGGFRDPVVVPRASTCGVTLQALAAPPAGDFDSVDEVSFVEVELGRGQTLSSCTRAQMLAGANLALIGSAATGYEILNFQDADLIAEDTYRLSNFYRARKDTAPAAKKHLKYDDFLLLSTAIRIPLLATDVGVERTMYAVTYGASTADATEVKFTIMDGGSVLRDPTAKLKIVANGVDLVEGRKTDVRRPVFTGSGSPGDYVGLQTNVNGAETARVLVGESGTWSYAPAADLADGVYAAAYSYVRAGPIGPVQSALSPSFAYEIAPAEAPGGSVAAKYFRLLVTRNRGSNYYVTVDHFDFYDADETKIEIPYGNWSSSGSLSDYQYGPDKAFTQDNSAWVGTKSPSGSWVQGWFNDVTNVARIIVRGWPPFDTSEPVDFEIQGSNDGLEFVTLKTVVDADTTTDFTVSF